MRNMGVLEVFMCSVCSTALAKFASTLRIEQDDEISRVLSTQQRLLRWEVQRKLDMKRAPLLVFTPDDGYNAQSEVDSLLDQVGAPPQHAAPSEHRGFT